MKSQLMYVELKSGYNDSGPAWIGKAFFSKTGRTIYFNGKAFLSTAGRGITGNYMDVESNDEYWISGIKKQGSNRHWAGSGKIKIDKDVVSEFLELVGISELKKSQFEIVSLDNHPPKEKINAILNLKI